MLKYIFKKKFSVIPLIVISSILLTSFLSPTIKFIKIDDDDEIPDTKDIDYDDKIPVPLHFDSVEIIANVYEKGFQNSHKELCLNDGENINLAVLIPSAVLNKKERNAIRYTWGHLAMRRDVVVAFIIGKTNDSELEIALSNEDNLNGDLIRGKNLDSYKNLTLKSINILEWIITYCPKVKAVLKCDDDMFINIPNIIKFVHAHYGNGNKIYGHLNENAKANRSVDHKNYIPYEEYNKSVFPNFISGSAYLMMNLIIKPIYEICFESILVRLEDVFITGILADKLNIERVNAKQFRLEKIPPRCYLEKICSMLTLTISDQYKYFVRLYSNKRHCSKTGYDKSYIRIRKNKANLRIFGVFP